MSASLEQHPEIASLASRRKQKDQKTGTSWIGGCCNLQPIMQQLYTIFTAHKDVNSFAHRVVSLKDLEEGNGCWERESCRNEVPAGLPLLAGFCINFQRYRSLPPTEL